MTMSLINILSSKDARKDPGVPTTTIITIMTIITTTSLVIIMVLIILIKTKYKIQQQQ